MTWGTEGLGEIVNNLEEVAVQVTRAQPPVHAARVLGFLSKVAHVVDQAYRDVLALLIDIRFVSDDALASGELRDLKRRLAHVLERSHYRDAEEICSRLKTLKETYLSELRDFVAPEDGDEWSGLFGLIEDREGRIIMMIHGQLSQLESMLNQARVPEELDELREAASAQMEAIRRDLADLNTFTTRILGLSGKQGLIEMLRDERDQSLVVGELSLMIDKRQHHNYSTGSNSILVGAGATTGDIHYEQHSSLAGLNLGELAEQLRELRAAMRDAATGDADQDDAIGAVAAAEKAARAGDRQSVIGALKRAGKWTLNIAEKIGLGLAVAALKPAIGLAP